MELGEKACSNGNVGVGVEVGGSSIQDMIRDRNLDNACIEVHIQ